MFLQVLAGASTFLFANIAITLQRIVHFCCHSENGHYAEFFTLLLVGFFVPKL